jgi:hypothetical protein
MEHKDNGICHEASINSLENHLVNINLQYMVICIPIMIVNSISDIYCLNNNCHCIDSIMDDNNVINNSLTCIIEFQMSFRVITIMSLPIEQVRVLQRV